MEKSCRKCASKGSPRPLFNFANNPKQPQENFLKIRFSEKGLSTSLKKVVYFFFRTQSL